ncbi:hypothetical protein ACFYS8_12400 [Kitasatospora sp. NPDC004615]|uniref:hypothetical protein n=1 Tax=Kitasatospora sp. NPDC004615 TaxID=3364017 RepID=UPI003678803A
MDPLTGHGPTQQDRADFEYALGRAFADPAVRTALTGDTSQATRLRILARQRTEEILAAAEPEYLTYCRLRDAAPAAPGPAAEPGERMSGWFGALALVVPIVSGSAAAVFFLLASLIGLSSPHAFTADVLRTAAWSTVAIAVASALIGLLGLLFSASRQRATPSEEPQHTQELSAARTAWRTALLHRGLIPFLLAAPRPAAPAPEPLDD